MLLILGRNAFGPNPSDKWPGNQAACVSRPNPSDKWPGNQAGAMYKKGTGNDKQGKEAGNRTLCPYGNFSQAIIFDKASTVENKICNCSVVV